MRTKRRTDTAIKRTDTATKRTDTATKRRTDFAGIHFKVVFVFVSGFINSDQFYNV